uniref:CCHC-type domain-containing protein n=1 Tax=Caenorhabditis japonica TaxID=281687 RepID=A0A8R1IGH1_CAEJA
ERGPFIGRVESAATTSMATNESVDFGSDTRRFKRQAESREDEPERLHAKMPVRCYACQRQGHYASECPQLRRYCISRKTYRSPEFLENEVNKLQQSGVVVECRTPRVVSPLQVAVNKHSISRQREMAITVVEHQSMGETQRQQIPLSPDLRNIGPAQFKWIPRAENTEADEASRDFDYDDWSVHDWVFRWAQNRWGKLGCDWFANRENAKTANFYSRFAEPGSAGADVRRKASLLGQNLPSTAKAYLSECNRRWLWSDGKRMLVGGTGEQRFLLFLAERSLEVGSSALAKAVAAFQLSNSTLSPFAAQLSSDIIKSRKKSEIFHRTQPKKVSEDVVLKIIESVTDERKSEKDTLLVAILWYVLLRAEEAANLQWQDIGGHRGTFKVTVRQAKNDQLALGRSTFVECKEGSLLMNPIKSKYVFPNLTNGAKLSARAVAEISKEKLASVGMVATHHALRRGAANHLQEKGLTFEQIKARGR